MEIGVTLAVVLVAFLAVRAWRRRPDAGPTGFGSRVLVAVARPSTAVRLSQLAAALAAADRGRVTPVAVLDPRSTTGDRERADETVRRCEATVIEEGLEARGRVRVDASVADGLLHGTLEYDASCLVMGWPSPRDQDRFGGPVDALVARSRVPVLLARLDGYRWRRIVLRVPREPTDAHLRASLRLATEVADRLGRRLGLDVVCTSVTTRIPETPSQLVMAPLAARAETSHTALAATSPGSDVVLVIAPGSTGEPAPARSSSLPEHESEPRSARQITRRPGASP